MEILKLSRLGSIFGVAATVVLMGILPAQASADSPSNETPGSVFVAQPEDEDGGDDDSRDDDNEKDGADSQDNNQTNGNDRDDNRCDDDDEPDDEGIGPVEASLGGGVLGSLGTLGIGRLMKALRHRKTRNNPQPRS
ncbi:MAG TPA: hypothetical protein VFZ58_05545 [Candidatus Saccharimonadales bacterium]